MDRNLVKENPHCKGCVYLCDPYGNFAHCDYIGYVGHSRGCPVDGCTKKEEKKKKKKSTPVYVKFCEECGTRFKTTGARTKYCQECRNRFWAPKK